MYMYIVHVTVDTCITYNIHVLVGCFGRMGIVSEVLALFGADIFV